MADKTIYLVANSHIDPVWLWDKFEGIDEVLNTFRSACDRLDEYPQLAFTASSICFLQWTLQYDAPLFERIKVLVDSGRWEIVGRWWIEPDCNLPMTRSFEKSAELSRAFLDKHFDKLDIPTAFCPDSFGHPASLPTILTRQEFKYYLFCRPDFKEKPDLPANLFYWEHQGNRVLCYRPVYHYSQGLKLDCDVIDKTLADDALVQDGFGCCLFGVGDHGGGPTKEEIDYWSAQNAVPNNRHIEFSTCRDYFERAEKLENIPTYSGDLHMHAVGCYSVNRNIKQAVRDSENVLAYTDRLIQVDGRDSAELDPLWEKTIFNQFHDILPGSCTPDAARQALDELGSVKNSAMEMSYDALRTIAAQRPPRYREGEFRVFNSLPHAVTAPVEIESFVFFKEGAPFKDNSGNTVSIQEVTSEVYCDVRRWFFIDTFEAQSERGYYFDSDSTGDPPSVAMNKFALGTTISKGEVTVDAPGQIQSSSGSWFTDPICLSVIDDPSDTWGHGVQGFPQATANFEQIESVIQCGELVTTLISRQKFGRSTAEMIFRIYDKLPWVDLEIRMQWCEDRKILKMVLSPFEPVNSLWVQAPGAAIEKKTDQIEEPLQGWLLAGTFGFVQNGAFAYDRWEDRLRVTLVRSNLYGSHDPAIPDPLAPLIRTDQYEHRFNFRFFLDPSLEPSSMDRHYGTLVEPFRIVRMSG